ncbi:MAG: HD domain-containing protein [Planctomycetota bacterium]|nr:HD domain-containing protein [Planctomycetota bacterium]
MLPETDSLHQIGSLVRIPPADDVPLSARVRRVLDTAPMRRLGSISQLGMVSLVYPGANHSRLEHTLGVYHNALRLIARFSADDEFTSRIDQPMAEAFVLAALLHDVGHWPFCHPIEDMQLGEVGEHETRIADVIDTSELGQCIEQDWLCNSQQVIDLLEPNGVADERATFAMSFLASCLSGPIDIDKLDYLQRDSLHAGVPYGSQFDVGRLISSVRINPQSARLAIDEKGRTAAELMVFARYVMFSEVYWHHAVRSATAMLQRSIFLLQNRVDLISTLRMTDAEWIVMLRRSAEGSVAEPLVEGLFGPTRNLYKRVAEFNVIDGGLVHQRLARKPYWWLVVCAERLAQHLTQVTGLAIHAADILIDAPPAKLEVDINMDVIGRDGAVRTLGDVSAVASALAERQFDDQVKSVRVFVRPDLRAALQSEMESEQWNEQLLIVSESLEKELV